jgi:hypothetical protein
MGNPADSAFIELASSYVSVYVIENISLYSLVKNEQLELKYEGKVS